MSVLVTFETQGECLARPMDVEVCSSAEQFRSGPGRPLETHGGTRWRGASRDFGDEISVRRCCQDGRMLLRSAGLLNVVRENLTFSADSRAVSGSAWGRDVEELLLLRAIGATRSGIGGDRELIR